MIEGLKLLHLPGHIGDNIVSQGNCFVLQTCQRTLIVSFNQLPSHIEPTTDSEIYSGKSAYQFLLETVTGLKSRLQGECEIMGQFKTGHQHYRQLPHSNSHLLTILEKLFKDAKHIRHHYLHGIGQQSYAGITRRLLDQKERGKKVLILGSGSLARDLIKVLSKRYQISLSARNQFAATELAKQFKIDIIPWGDHHHYHPFSTIINTIGAETILFDHQFFCGWPKFDFSNRLFVDLGSPSVLETPYGKEEGVWRLEDLFQLGETLNQQKRDQLNKAMSAIEQLVDQRRLSLSINLPFGWEELQFA